MLFKNNKNKKINLDKEESIDFILPLYLNQRFVYDILAIKNNGFTEFFEIKDKNERINELEAKVNGGFGNNNKFSLIQADIGGKIDSKSSEGLNNEKSYKKTHTPTSLFMQAYQYLKNNKKIYDLKEMNDIDKINCGDFIEIKSAIELNTVVEFFETMDKVIDITNAFSTFASSNNKSVISNPIGKMKKSVENLIKILEKEGDNVKYGICKLGEKDIVIRLNKEFFINSDYSEIKNGEFRIIGKVLEIVSENHTVILNRENAVGLYDPNIFSKVKEAIESIPNINFKEFKDVVYGKTIVVMPIAIGI